MLEIGFSARAFAGFGAAPRLKKDVDVVLVDKHDYHTFRPLSRPVACLDLRRCGRPTLS